MGYGEVDPSDHPVAEFAPRGPCADRFGALAGLASAEAHDQKTKARFVAEERTEIEQIAGTESFQDNFEIT